MVSDFWHSFKQFATKVTVEPFSKSIEITDERQMMTPQMAVYSGGVSAYDDR